MGVGIDPASFEEFRREVEALQARLRDFPAIAAGEVRPAFERALMVLQSEASDYPTQNTGSWYRRTGTLGRLWTTASRVIEGSGLHLTGKVGNRTPYGPLVMGPGTQIKIHRGRWRTTDQVLAENVETVNAVLAEAGGKIVEKLKP